MADLDEKLTPPKKPRAAPRRRKAEAPPDTPDPIEIAMAAVATGADRHGAARAVLEKHACLIDIQCEREKEELGVLRVQRLTRWLILVAVAAVIAALGALVWNASRSTSLVIEPFGVPPALAQRGLTGKVVSARILDQLAELQRSTESMRGEKSYANDWQDDIQLDIPQTGVSISEAWRTLKGWLGEETRIGGELVQTPAGIAITTRAGALSGGTVEGAEADFDRLVREAAASLYKATQPYRYAISLPPERRAEREQMLMALTGDPSPLERKWAYSGLSAHHRGLGDARRSLAMARQALAIDPDMLPAIGNVALSEQALGHEEAALESFRRALPAWERSASREYDERVSRLNLATFDTRVGERMGDAGLMRSAAKALLDAGASTMAATSTLTRARAASLVHDHSAAARIAAQMRRSQDPDETLRERTASALLRLQRALDERDAAAGAAAADEALKGSATATSIYPDPRVRGDVMARTVWPNIAIALGKLGLVAEAARLTDAVPTDCYDCLRAKGWAAMAGGDRNGARRWFEAAVRAAPSVPMAYADLGLALLNVRDRAGAARQFEMAAEKGPNWADGYKLWGDALALQGQDEEAERKYRSAAERAPRWGALHIAWGKTLWRLGRQEQAREKFRAAAGMDLSPADRTRLGRLVSLRQG